MFVRLRLCYLHINPWLLILTLSFTQIFQSIQHSSYIESFCLLCRKLSLGKTYWIPVDRTRWAWIIYLKSHFLSHVKQTWPPISWILHLTPFLAPPPLQLRQNWDLKVYKAKLCDNSVWFYCGGWGFSTLFSTFLPRFMWCIFQHSVCELSLWGWLKLILSDILPKGSSCFRKSSGWHNSWHLMQICNILTITSMAIKSLKISSV